MTTRAKEMCNVCKMRFVCFTSRGFRCLKNIPTRLLLKWRDRCYACGGGYDPTENNNNVIPLERIKEELAKREHIPNKKEAKRIRQLKAKARK